MVKVKKVSVISVESLRLKSTKLTKHWESVHLKDRLFYVRILFLLLGTMHFLPYTFFVTANAYWMHKFRNVSADDLYDASKRTSLQSHFASGVSMTNAIPNSLFAILSTLFGYRFAARSRVIVTLAIMTLCFVLTTLFVGVDTDSWQTLFFCITFAILATMIAANAVLQIAVLVLLAKFPPYFMKFYLFGQGCAAVFNSLLQIMTLSIGTSTTTSALIYFGLGSTIMATTLALFYFSKYNSYYTYFVEHFEDEETRDMLSLRELKGIVKVIWPTILMYMFYDLGRITQIPIMPLVVSENYGSGSKWSDVYFVPVVTFLLGDFCTLFGRVVYSMSEGLGIWTALAVTVARVIIYIPLTILCNAQPRKHLPVLLNHDWEYILVQTTLSFTNGYLMNLVYLSITRLMEPEKVEDGYMVLMSSMCTIGAVTSPLAAFCVDLL